MVCPVSAYDGDAAACACQSMITKRGHIELFILLASQFLLLSGVCLHSTYIKPDNACHDVQREDVLRKKANTWCSSISINIINFKLNPLVNIRSQKLK